MSIELKPVSPSSGAYEAGLVFESEVHGGEQRPVVAIGSNGAVSVNNSSQTPLAGGAAFTGTVDDVTEYTTIYVSVYSNVASATNGLSLQFRIDGTWRESDAYTVPAATFKTYALQPVASDFRVVYTNGAGAQATFELQTQYRKSGGVQNSHRVADDFSGQDDAMVVKSVIAAERPGTAGVYTNVQATNGGNLKVALEEVESSVLIVAATPLVPVAHDYVGITSYDANNNPLVIQYKTGGSGGTLVRTLTLTYDGSNRLTSVSAS